MELGDTTLDAEITDRKKSRKKFSEDEIISLLMQMVSVLSCLQRMNISHRDIKPHNVVKVG